MKKTVIIFSGDIQRLLNYLDEAFDNHIVTLAVSTEKSPESQIICGEKKLRCVEFNLRKFLDGNNYFGKVEEMPESCLRGYSNRLIKVFLEGEEPDIIILSGLNLETKYLKKYEVIKVNYDKNDELYIND